ncbi:MAG TPA: hypothetical protein VFS65_00880, partial [Candidatus Saccharimonadales bacterium]|nr:hypothetical protein [Candidatus Saccharimonadales bacterium]
LMAITTGQFIFIAQDGTPNVLYLFWPVWLMLLGILISKRSQPRTLYKIAFFIVAALSLYTPLSVYVLIALTTAVFLHPHLRYLTRQLSRIKLLIGLGVAALLTVPLVITVIKTPRLGLELLGIPTQWPDFPANLASLGAQYLGFVNPGGTTIMTPFFELGSMLIIAIGVYHIIRSRETAKSYVIALWVLCLIPFILLNPNFTAVAYLPLVLLLASGFSALLSYWYVLFPRNPYARFAGLIPLVVLVSVLVLSGVERYVHGYQYDPTIAPNFSSDLRLIPDETKLLVVANDELPFYQVLDEHNQQLSVSLEPAGDSFVATREAKRVFDGYTINEIITTSTKDAGDRFYVYTKITE